VSALRVALRRRRSRRAASGRGARGRSAGRGRTAQRRAVLRPRLPRLAPRTVAALVAVLALAGGGWIWVRHSSLVAVKRVTVIGVSGPPPPPIRAALVSEARTMTTLDVQLSHLRTAVSPFPVVKRLDVSTQFPHGMRIRVTEQVPVAVIDVAGRRTTVAADGTLLRDVTSGGSLPSITLAVEPGGTHVSGTAEQQVRLLAAAPYQLLARVASASSDAIHGLTAQLRNGPTVYFGGAGELAAKWRAVTDVLADSSSAGATYIDVSVPSRPAAGTGSDGGPTTTASTGGASAGADQGTGTTPAGADQGTSTAPVGADQSTSTTPGATDQTGGTGTSG